MELAVLGLCKKLVPSRPRLVSAGRMSPLTRRAAVVSLAAVSLGLAFLLPEPKARATPPEAAEVAGSAVAPAFPFSWPLLPPAPPLAATAPRPAPPARAHDDGGGCGRNFHTPFEGRLALRSAYRTAEPKVYQFCPSWSGFGKVRGHRNHGGVDISAKTGTPVRAGVDGELVYLRDPHGYGSYARIRFSHPRRTRDGGCGPAGEAYLIYAHLLPESVKVGAPPRHVRVGEIIGKVGCSGNARGMCSPSPESHLHVTVQRADGARERVEPVSFLGWSVHSPEAAERGDELLACNARSARRVTASVARSVARTGR